MAVWQPPKVQVWGESHAAQMTLSGKGIVTSRHLWKVCRVTGATDGATRCAANDAAKTGNLSGLAIRVDDAAANEQRRQSKQATSSRCLFFYWLARRATEQVATRLVTKGDV